MSIGSDIVLAPNRLQAIITQPMMIDQFVFSSAYIYTFFLMSKISHDQPVVNLVVSLLCIHCLLSACLRFYLRNYHVPAAHHD